MTTLDSKEAAEFLKCSVATIQRKANAGEIAAIKIKGWRFLEQSLVSYAQCGHTHKGELLRVIDGGKQQEENLCPSTSVRTKTANPVKRGGYNTPMQTAKEYSVLLGLPTKEKPKNSTTNSKRSRGQSAS